MISETDYVEPELSYAGICDVLKGGMDADKPSYELRIMEDYGYLPQGYILPRGG